jgi:hypothetical protein
MILSADKRLKAALGDNMSFETIVAMIAKANMGNGICEQWLQHFPKHKITGNTLRIFDGGSFHLDADPVRASDSSAVIFYCLPSNTTHELQPFDKSISKAFNRIWMTNFQSRNRKRSLTKSRFGNPFQ